MDIVTVSIFASWFFKKFKILYILIDPSTSFHLKPENVFPQNTNSICIFQTQRGNDKEGLN